MKVPPISPCDRVNFILERIRGKKVLHIGCADWPFTENKVKKGSLLHQKMVGVANKLVGLDLVRQGVTIMQEAGIDNVYVVNSEMSVYDYLHDKFDVVVAGEILEHVLNAGNVFDSIKTVCHKKSVVIITAPNFAPIKRLPRLLWRNENVHPDHVCYYSFSTLSQLFSQCDFEPIEWRVYWRDVGTISKVVNRVLRMIPFLQYYADGFCVLCAVR